MNNFELDFDFTIGFQLGASLGALDIDFNIVNMELFGSDAVDDKTKVTNSIGIKLGDFFGFGIEQEQLVNDRLFSPSDTQFVNKTFSILGFDFTEKTNNGTGESSREHQIPLVGVQIGFGFEVNLVPKK